MWEAINATYYDSMTTFVDIPTTVLLHATDATAALAQSLADNPINLYTTDNSYLYTLMPTNNLNFSVIGSALATSKTVKGYALDTTTLKATADQNLSPLEKTKSNCVLGSYLASAGAALAVDTLGSIDPATMLGDLDPVTMLTDLETQLKGY